MIVVLGLTACGNKEVDIRPTDIPQEETTSPNAFVYELTEDESGVIITDFFSLAADGTEIVIPKNFLIYR